MNADLKVEFKYDQTTISRTLMSDTFAGPDSLVCNVYLDKSNTLLQSLAVRLIEFLLKFCITRRLAVVTDRRPHT